MGLFGNLSKPGPGVSKDGPEKNRFFMFFELIFRKFFKLIQLNLLYIVTLIPLLSGIYLSVEINPEILNDITNISKMPTFIFTGEILGIILIVISVFVTGPATAGFTYVIRNFQREEHAWVFSDFFERFKKNYKQGVLVSIIDVIGYFLIYVAFSFYMFDANPEVLKLAPFFAAVVIVVGFLFLFSHYYIYTMMVTFDLKLKDLIRNSFLFGYAKLPLNIVLTVLLGALILLSIRYMTIGLIAYIVIGLSLYGYIITYMVYPSIDKFMIKPVTKNEEEIQSDFSDNV